MLRWYRDGSVNLTQGSAAIVGVNTLWLVALSPGDLFTLDDGLSFFELGSIQDNTHATLSRVYTGATLTGQSYAVARLFGATDYSKVAAQTIALMTTWQARDDEFSAWVSGTVNGGPGSDGRYPVRDAQGTQHLLYSPAFLSQTYAQVAEDFVTLAGYRSDAQSARDAAVTAQGAAATSASSATASATAASGYASAASASATTAASAAASATTKAEEAAASAATATSEADRASAAADTATNAAGGETANVPNALVKRDASGNFSAGTITADLTGTASGNIANAEIPARQRYLQRLNDLAAVPTYDGSNNLLSVSYADGCKGICSYTGDNLTKVEYTDTNGSTVLHTLTLTYDGSGNYTGRTWS